MKRCKSYNLILCMIFVFAAVVADLSSAIIVRANMVEPQKGMLEPVSTFGHEAEEEFIHLLFAKIVYDNLDEYEGKTVSQYVEENPKLYNSPIWSDSDITYEALYNHVIGDWNIYKIYDNNTVTGFYGVAFKKGDRVVLAFRGSEMIPEDLSIGDSNDWTGTDFRFAIMNKLSNQFDDADIFYRQVVYELMLEEPNGQFEITLTGHSLGGALVAYESIISDCYGYSFDGACGHVIDLIYFYGYLDIDGFTGVDDLDNIKFCNYTDETGYVIADLIQHTNSQAMYQIDRETNIENLNENTLLPRFANAESHIIWSYVGHEGGNVYLNPKVNPNEYGYTYMPEGPVYLDITKNIIETGMENVSFDTPWNLIDYSSIDYEYLVGSMTGAIKHGRIVLSTKKGGALCGYNDIGVSSAFDIDMVMYGGAGPDKLCGYVGNDVLLAGGSENYLDGGLGDDTYIIDKCPEGKTHIVDIGGSKTNIILRNFNINAVKNLKVSEGKIDLGEGQYLTVNVATPMENVQLFTYNNGKLNRIGVLSRVGGHREAEKNFVGSMSKFTNVDKKIAIFEGRCTFDIIDSEGNVACSVSNLQEKDFNSMEYDFGMVYTNGVEGEESLLAVVSDEYTIRITTETRGNLAYAKMGSDNSFLGCERMYQRRLYEYEPDFEDLYENGVGQGETDLDDAIYSGVNFLFELFSK